MSQRTRADAQLFTHSNYSLSTSPATKTLPTQCTSILVENMSSTAAETALISFDAGVTFKTIKAGSAINLDVDNMKSYVIKSGSGAPSVECLYASEA